MIHSTIFFVSKKVSIYNVLYNLDFGFSAASVI